MPKPPLDPRMGHTHHSVWGFPEGIALADSTQILAKRRSLADVPGLIDAVARHADDPIRRTDGLPGPDPLRDLRVTARILTALQHDTPERRALGKLLRLETEGLTGKPFVELSKNLLKEVEKIQASATYENPWTAEEYHDLRPAVQGLNTHRLSDVMPREVEWQRRGFTALGKLTLLSGPPGVGKTWLMLDHIARLTTGRPFPHSDPKYDVVGRRNALFVSSEDADDDTLRPRIETLKGDASRVHTLRFVIDDTQRQRSLSLDRHCGELDRWLAGHPLVELVVFDPISAILGKVDSHKDADVRSVLGPLAKIAERRRVAIVCVAHLNKSSDGQAIYRSIGSVGFIAAARIAWQVCADVESPGRSLLLPVKMNIGPRPEGLAFRITTGGLVWDAEPVGISADEALNGPSQNKRDEAKDFIREVLKDGRMLATEVLRMGKDRRFGESTIKFAKRELGVRSDRDGGMHGVSYWSLPDGSDKPP